MRANRKSGRRKKATENKRQNNSPIRRANEAYAKRIQYELYTKRNNIPALARLSLQPRNRLRTTSDVPTQATTVFQQVTQQARNLPKRFYPVSFKSLNPCKRAKTAERHNVFRKIKQYGSGSIKSRTFNRIKKGIC